MNYMGKPWSLYQFRKKIKDGKIFELNYALCSGIGKTWLAITVDGLHRYQDFYNSLYQKINPNFETLEVKKVSIQDNYFEMVTPKIFKHCSSICEEIMDFLYDNFIKVLIFRDYEDLGHRKLNNILKEWTNPDFVEYIEQAYLNSEIILPESKYAVCDDLITIAMRYHPRSLSNIVYFEGGKSKYANGIVINKNVVKRFLENVRDINGAFLPEYSDICFSKGYKEMFITNPSTFVTSDTNNEIYQEISRILEVNDIKDVAGCSGGNDCFYFKNGILDYYRTHSDLEYENKKFDKDEEDIENLSDVTPKKETPSKKKYQKNKKKWKKPKKAYQ